MSTPNQDLSHLMSPIIRKGPTRKNGRIGQTGLAYDDPTWSLRRVKELLTDLIRSRVIYEWDEAVLYSLLLRKGLLNLHENNRHRQFFKNLLGAVLTNEGRQLVENYVKSDSDIPPNLAISKLKQFEDLEEIQPASPEELSQIVENVDPLEYGRFKNVEHILKQTDVLESINVDEEAMQFYLNYSIDELWKLAFQNEEKTVNEIRFASRSGNKYTDAVIESFLTDYKGSKEIKPPAGYLFPYLPSLMQTYVAYKIKSLPYFGNFSATGAGKTLSAILASRVIDSKMTLIVCPNDVVEQWRRNIKETFLNSNVVTGKGAFDAKYSKSEYQYLVLNYDKFSQEYSPNLILSLGEQQVDFVIMDEIHFTKIRDEEEVSKRRRNLDGLMTLLRKRNPLIKVLGLSATPVVNNLREGKSLVELITGKIYDDLNVKYYHLAQGDFTLFSTTIYPFRETPVELLKLRDQITKIRVIGEKIMLNLQNLL